MGHIINMKLNDGSPSTCFIQTCAHNVVQSHPMTHELCLATSVVAFLRMNGEDNYEKAINVKQFVVYPKYLEDPNQNQSGFDYAILHIEIPPEQVWGKNWDVKFYRSPSIHPNLARGHKISIYGYPGDQNDGFQLWGMEGTIHEIVLNDDEHGIIIYED